MERKATYASKKKRNHAILILLAAISFVVSYVCNFSALMPPLRYEDEFFRSPDFFEGDKANNVRNSTNAPTIFPTVSVADMSSLNSSLKIKSHTTTTTSMMWQYPVATEPYKNEKRVIAMLCMGPNAANSTLVERIMVSIRKRGNYLGVVWLLTDISLRDTRYASLQGRDPNLIVMRPLKQDWKLELRRDMPYKRFKTYLLEYLDRNEQLRSAEFVYYLDIDIVVGQPLEAWFKHVERNYVNLSYPSQIIMFEGNTPMYPVQGGQFVLRRNHSEPCLERWRHFIDSFPEEHKDQLALL